MKSKQLRIRGLEGLEKATANASRKRQNLSQQIKALQDRVLRLELEVSLLRILMENPKQSDKNDSEGETTCQP